MGKIDFIRRFIPDFPRMVKMIHNMLKQDRVFSWNAITEKDFVEIENAISYVPILEKPDFAKFLSYTQIPLKNLFM
jgi:hypothetical protein